MNNKLVEVKNMITGLAALVRDTDLPREDIYKSLYRIAMEVDNMSKDVEKVKQDIIKLL